MDNSERAPGRNFDSEPFLCVILSEAKDRPATGAAGSHPALAVFAVNGERTTVNGLPVESLAGSPFTSRLSPLTSSHFPLPSHLSRLTSHVFPAPAATAGTRPG